MHDGRGDVSTLTDEELIELISDLPPRELNLVQRMLIQAEVYDIPQRLRACEIIMRTSPSRWGRRSDQIVEALSSLQDRDIDPDELMGLGDYENGDKESKRSIFDPKRWSLGGDDSEGE